MKKSLFIVTILLLTVFVVSLGLAQAKEYKYVIVPKIVHPWFDKVNQGAQEMAEFLEKITGDTFVIDYRAPATASVVEQNRILEQAAATEPATT